MTALAPGVSLRPARPGDVDTVAALKERVLRGDLEPLVGWDPARSRARVVEHFSPAHTWMILVDGETAGTITLRPDRVARCGWRCSIWTNGTRDGASDPPSFAPC